MRLKNCILFLGILLVVISCKEVDPNKQIDEGNIQDNIYISKEIGWRIEVPKDWKIITRAQNENYREKGKEVVEEVIEGEIDYTELKDLIGFQKDVFNSFLSNSQIFDEAYDGEWKENNVGLKSLMVDAFEQRGIKIETTSTTIVRIDGLDFEHYKFMIFDKEDKIILNQLIYNRLIDGYDFGVNINYNNEEDMETLKKALFDSKFRKRN